VKGLIIDEPWIGLILSGQKTWEMRKTACHHRGSIALIRKGSGQVVGRAEYLSHAVRMSSEDDANHRAQSVIAPASMKGWR
jgi:hypothetical protein